MSNPTRCPIGGCAVLIRHPHLMCRNHWYKVPKHIRDQIWSLFQNEAGSDRHRRACFDAIESVTKLVAKSKAAAHG